MVDYADMVLGGRDKDDEPKRAPAPDYADLVLNGPRAPQPEPETRPASGNAAGDFLSAAGGAIASGAGAVKDFVTGDGRREFDYPELPGRFIPGFGEIGAKMALAQTDEGQADIFKKAFPDAVLSKDKFGNTIAEMEGQKFYLNRPGFSGQDVDNFGANVAITAPFGMVGGALTKGLNLGLRALGVGAGGAAGSVAQDVAAGAAGSEQGISPANAVGNAVFAGGSEMLAPAASALFRQIASDRKLFDPATGTLTEAGKFTLQQAGLDPSQVTDDYLRQFTKLAKGAANPADAAVAAVGKSLPVEVPLTKGDITRRASDQMFEDLAEKGAYGKVPESILRTKRQEQQDALWANVDAMKAGLTKGYPVTSAPNQAGAILQDALNTRAVSGNAIVDKAYDAARETKAGIPLTDAQGLRFMIGGEQEVRDRIAHSPKAQGQLAELDKLTNSADSSVLVSALFDWRRQTTTLASEAADRTDASALRAMVRRFDEVLPAIAKEGLMSGDQNAINAWKTAIRKRRQYGKLFEGNDLVQDILEKEQRSGSTVFKVPPEQVSNYIFGLADTGFVNKPNLARDLKRVRQIVGESSVEWNALREEAFMRLARAAEGPYVRDAGRREFSGAKFANALDTAMERNPQIMKTLFSPEELKTLDLLKQAAIRTTTVTKGGANFSNTTPALANLGQRLMKSSFLGEKARVALLAAMPVLGNVGYGVKAVGATSGEVALKELPPGLIGSTGAAAINAGQD